MKLVFTLLALAIGFSINAQDNGYFLNCNPSNQSGLFSIKL